MDGYYKCQGLINLIDSTENEGGFCTVPGFHKVLKDWAIKTKESAYAYQMRHVPEFVNVPKNDKMNDQYQKITSRSGSLIIWNSEQPHCNFPNNSNTFRMNQYIKMFIAKERGIGVDDRKFYIKKYLGAFENQLSTNGKKLLGLESYLQFS